MGEKITYRDWLKTIMNPDEIARLDPEVLGQMIEEERRLSEQLKAVGNENGEIQLWETDPDTGELLCDKEGDYITTADYDVMMSLLMQGSKVGNFLGIEVDPEQRQRFSSYVTDRTEMEEFVPHVAIDMDFEKASSYHPDVVNLPSVQVQDGLWGTLTGMFGRNSDPTVSDTPPVLPPSSPEIAPVSNDTNNEPDEQLHSGEQV